MTHIQDTALLSDMIETTASYKQAMQEVQPILEKEFKGEPKRPELWNRMWIRKKQLLKERGICWQTPAKINSFE